jgi:hypothetical protein
MFNTALFPRIEFFLQAFNRFLALHCRVVPMDIPIISFMAMSLIDGFVTDFIPTLV